MYSGGRNKTIRRNLKKRIKLSGHASRTDEVIRFVEVKPEGKKSRGLSRMTYPSYVEG